MRILLKGGVWKNTEDEILKAAVMKYGKNQWARISSLLVRKSPKQCKQRWYEWLDPSIKKTAWTREEEEKLLHLAKIMPTQWRTISACLDGRTPSQCLSHYETLLDRAQGKDNMDPADDPRRLRPGEIDPNPEVKPALPDPVDMDEDEKEMLQEARARLANTKGKKAKRKARERTLDEARRLAALQKRRELKQAGIHVPVPSMRKGGSTKKKKRSRMIDVMAEIPFHKTAPVGFYDTAKEEEAEIALRKNPKFHAVTLKKLEGERKQEVDERQRKEDEQKMKQLKQTNLPVAMAKLAKLQDPHGGATKRPALNLPAPQISNAELEDIAKLSSKGSFHAGDEDAEGSVTASLLPQLDATPAMITPMRTPMAKPGENNLMRDATYLAALTREAQTPLLGGHSVTLQSDFSGAQPAARPMVTPNVLKTPAVASQQKNPTQSNSIMTPLGNRRTGPADEDALALPESRNEGRGVSGLFASLSALPAPKNSYQLVVPSQGDDADDDERVSKRARSEGMEQMDAADIQKLSLSRQAELSRQREALLSSVVKRGLPIPAASSQHVVAPPSGERSVIEEMMRLVEHDKSHNSHVGDEGKGKKKKKGKKSKGSTKRGRPEEPEGPVPLEDGVIELEILAARREMSKEWTAAQAARVEETYAQFAHDWDALSSSLIITPDGSLVQRSSLTAQELVAALKHNYNLIHSAVKARETQCHHLEEKLNVFLGGYAVRADQIAVDVQTAFESLEQSRIDRICFTDMATRESAAAMTRIHRLTEELLPITSQEESLQAQYQRYSAMARK